MTGGLFVLLAPAGGVGAVLLDGVDLLVLSVAAAALGLALCIV